jgi:hypothetical protein
VADFLSHSPANTWKIVIVLAWTATLAAGLLFWRLLRGTLSLSNAAAILILGVLFRPIGLALLEGQVQLLITACFGISLVLWQGGLATSSGATLSLTCTFKPQLGLFMFWGLIRRQWRFAIGFAIVTSILLAASSLHFGLRNHLDYLPVLNYLSHHGEAFYPNQSLNGMLNRLLHNGDASIWNLHDYPPYNPMVYWPTAIFSLICIVCGLWIPVRDGWQGTSADFLLFGCLTVLVSPIAWHHHYGGFYYLFIYLLARHEQIFAQWKWLWLALAYLVMVDRFPRLDEYLYGLPSLLDNYLFFGSILALVTLIWAEKTSKTAPRMRLATNSA